VLSRFTPFARLAIVLVLVGAFLIGSGLAPSEAGAARATRQDVVNWIYEYAAYYGVSAQVLLAVGQCESGLQPYPRDGRAGEIGTFQFHPRGVWWNTPYAWWGYSPRDPEINVAAAAWAFSRGYQSHWSCYRWAR
jgi:hypothetical protein